MMAWKAGLITSMTMFGVGDLPLPEGVGPVLQWGALGVLAWATAQLFKELREQRADAKAERAIHTGIITELCTRWDGWEKTRHDDHESLTETLATMRENCAAVAGVKRGGKQ